MQSLIDGLDTVDSDLWKDVMVIQKNWIGECTGCRIEFNIKVIEHYWLYIVTHFSWELPKRVVGKQCRPRSDEECAECGV